MDAQEMWRYCGLARKVSGEYQAWAFGDDPDTLAELVLQGIKTATASAYPSYIESHKIRLKIFII